MNSETQKILQIMLGGKSEQAVPAPKPIPQNSTTDNNLRQMLDAIWSEPGCSHSASATNKILLKANDLNLVAIVDASALSAQNKTEEQLNSIRLFAALSAGIGLISSIEELIANGDDSKKTAKEHLKAAKELDKVIEAIDKYSKSVTVYIL